MPIIFAYTNNYLLANTLNPHNKNGDTCSHRHRRLYINKCIANVTFVWQHQQGQSSLNQTTRQLLVPAQLKEAQQHFDQ